MFIRYHFFDDMDDELFLRAFQEMFVCPDSRSPEELACEKAFLLCRPIHGSHCPQALGLLKLEEMLADERFSKLLKEKYNFSTIECGKYTGQHIFNDLYTQKYEEKIRGQEHWLNLTRQHIFKLENELEDCRRQIRKEKGKLRSSEKKYPYGQSQSKISAGSEYHYIFLQLETDSTSADDHR